MTVGRATRPLPGTPPPDSPRGRLEQALTHTLRSIADEPDLTVRFGYPQAMLNGKEVHLPAVPAEDRANPAMLTRLRGQADALALQIGYHDPALNQRLAPHDRTARTIFAAAETARIESLGASRMPGMGYNLQAWLETQCSESGMNRAVSRADVPLADIVGLLIRERSGTFRVPESVRNAVDLWRPWIEERAAESLDHLCRHLDDQQAFASLMQQVLERFDMPNAPLEEPPEESDSSSDDTEETSSQQQADADSDSEHEQGEGQTSEEEASGEHEDSPSQAHQGLPQDGEDSNAEAVLRPEDLLAGATTTASPYHVYSDDFDEVISPDALCSQDELLTLWRNFDRHLKPLQSGMTRLAHRLQRRLQAQQRRSWDFDLEEGMLDPARLTRIIIDPTLSLSYKQERETDFRDTAVSLLIDNSGSMRGRPISIAALCAYILVRVLERCDVRSEVLGFTTTAWKGGKSREKWMAEGRRTNPGRLNDLRHIIYKSADAPWRRSRYNMGLMMREGLLKENIDGEALIWAHNRLLKCFEQRRIMMVISDGAPVDDSTLSANNGTYLDRHLREIIGRIQAHSPIELIAIGIGHDVGRYYARAVTISEIDQLAGTMIDELAALFDRPAARR